MPPRRLSRLTIAVDTGGTFTDCVFRAGGRIEVVEISFDAGRPRPRDARRHRADSRACRRARRGDRRAPWHNGGHECAARAQRRAVAFVTTAGFEDTLAIGRQARPSLYDWNLHRPAAALRRRIAASASRSGLAPMERYVARPATTNSRSLLVQIRASRAESVAVSLLFSFANPAHERAVAPALAAAGTAAFALAPDSARVS